jgi:exodeoxyribonuclease V alpha subunit
MRLTMDDPTGNASDGTTVDGTVEHVLFESERDGWCALRLRTTEGDRLTAVGTLLGVQKGDRLRLSGRFVTHPRYGRQLEVTSWLQLLPTTLGGLRKFLGSGRIRGLGPTIAGRLVDAFGLDTLDVLEHHPERLREVPGIGPKRAATIRDAWGAHRGMQQVMVFLAGHGVGPGIAVRVFRRYGSAALDTVRSDPYRLADEVRGVGFLTADRIARSLGVDPRAVERQQAGILYALREAAGDGHVYLPRGALLESTAALLELGGEDLSPALDGLERAERVVTRELDGSAQPAVLLPMLDRAEETVARSIAGLLAAGRSTIEVDAPRALEWYQSRARLRLAGRQREALLAALDRPVLVVTGGPGTGKTTLLRGVTSILGAKGARMLLAAPTGRAAKRLQEATGLPARTIHRLLEFNPAHGRFVRGPDYPLEADLVVVDESSMVDVELAASLLGALPPRCRLVLVGDADQLPSVGPGNVLGDLISSGRVPVVELDEIFRQAEQSLIVVNAHRVNNGAMPLLGEGDELRDFYLVERDDPAAAAAVAVDLIARHIPRRFRLDPVDDVQLLAPMHRGELGVAALNDRLRSVLNPDGPEIHFGSRSFRVGDKVMQVRNNYELDVFNGDIGRVVSVDDEERRLVVRFDDRTVVVEQDDADDLVPAYAVTIHKAQGSEYPAVVVALHHQHHIMLQRNLLYTAITRGRRLVVVVGSRRALGRAVRNATVRRRHTLLAARLRRSG